MATIPTSINGGGGSSHMKPGESRLHRPVARNNNIAALAAEEAVEPAVGIVVYRWYVTPSASATAVSMLMPGVAVALSEAMPFRGSVIAMALSSDTSFGAGTFFANVTVNGVASQFNLPWTTGQRATIQQLKGTTGFARDDYINVTYTTNSAFNATAAKLIVTVYVAMDQSQTS